MELYHDTVPAAQDHNTPALTQMLVSSHVPEMLFATADPTAIPPIFSSKYNNCSIADKFNRNLVKSQQAQIALGFLDVSCHWRIDDGFNFSKCCMKTRNGPSILDYQQ